MENNIITFEAEKVKLSSGLFKDFVVCTAYLMSDGVNRNKSEFTLASLEKSLPTFENKPVLANIWFQKTNGVRKAYVGSHDWTVERDENGEEYISYKNGETPVGVITNKSQVSIQKYKGRNFVVAKLFLWKQYNPELIKILAKDKRKKVSVEVVFKDWEDYTDENGEKIRRVNDFDFLGVTILGHQKKIFGEPEPVEEGIAGSHLEVDENYAMSFSKALESNIEDRREVYDAFIKGEPTYTINKREAVLEELSSMFDNDVTLMSLSHPNGESRKEVEGKCLMGGDVYSYNGLVNIDGTCDLIVNKLNTNDKERFVKTQMQYFKQNNKQKNLIIQEVNLVDDIDTYDVDQLIYTIFTYQNSSDIVNLSFGNIDEGWEDNPYDNLSYPFASINQYSITFSKERIKKMEEGRLRQLYQSIETIPCFQEVVDMVKSIMKEKYEKGETSNVEKENQVTENDAVLTNEIDENKKEESVKENAAEEVVNSNDCNQENVNANECGDVEENATDKGEDECNTNDCGEEPKVDANDCGEDGPETNAEGDDEEGKPEDECNTNACDEEGENVTENTEDGKDEGEEAPATNAEDGSKNNDDADEKDGDDKDDDKDGEFNKEEELAQKYEVAVSQIASYSEQVKVLQAELETAQEKINKLSEELQASFIREVEGELSSSALDKSHKEDILSAAKEHKFANITDVQKEIAFVEKQTRSDSYTFVSNVLKTSKPEKGGDVFDRLNAKNKW